MPASHTARSEISVNMTSSTTPASVPRPERKAHARPGRMNAGFFGELSRNGALYIMALPAVFCFLVFNYLPMAGALIAFKNYNFTTGFWGIFSSPFMDPWYGNFEFFFTSGYAWRVTRNTLLLNGAFIALGILFEVGLAIVLNEIRSRRFKKTIQSVTFLPYFVSWIVLSVFLYNLLNYDNGVINGTLTAWGLPKINFYAEAGIWPFIMVLIHKWKFTGYGVIIYLAAISSINDTYYEAARIDGARKWQQVWHLTLPLLRPTIFILALLSIGRIMNADFGMFNAVVGNNAQLFPTVDVIDTFVYRALRQSSDLGMSAAAGFFQSCLAFIIVLCSNWLVKKYQEDGALF